MVATDADPFPSPPLSSVPDRPHAVSPTHRLPTPEFAPEAGQRTDLPPRRRGEVLVREQGVGGPDRLLDRAGHGPGMPPPRPRPRRRPRRPGRQLLPAAGGQA